MNVRTGILLLLAALTATASPAVEESKEKLPKCTFMVTPRPGTSHTSKSHSGLINSTSSLGSNSGTKTVTRSLKWRVETLFRDERPEKLELKAYYLGYNDKNKTVQIGAETKVLAIDEKGHADIDLTSPTTRLTRSRTTSSTSRHSSNSSGFRSTKTTTRGERVTGCVIQLFADGKLLKSWTSDSRWTIEAKNVPFSIENLNKSDGRIGFK